MQAKRGLTGQPSTLLRLLLAIITLVLATGCYQKPTRRADWYEKQIEFLGRGEKAPFDGLLITERLFMELFEDQEKELLERRTE